MVVVWKCGRFVAFQYIYVHFELVVDRNEIKLQIEPTESPLDFEY